MSDRTLLVDDPIHITARGTTIEAYAEPGRVWLDIDGEPLRALPANRVAAERAHAAWGL